jgi:predicted metal-dependent TIM-barrel fold hydrolase
MRIFEPHAHMTSRTTDDYQAMAAAGVRAMVEPAFWLGQPRTSPGSFVDYFNSLLGWERFRASQFGIRHHCAIGLNPKEASDPTVRREVLELLPRFLAKDGVVAVGEIGFDSMNAVEEETFSAQLTIAREHELPVLVHTPHRDKLAGTRRTLELVEQSGWRRGWRSWTTTTSSPWATSTRPAAGSGSRSIPGPRWTSTAWCGSSRSTGPSG